MRVGLGIPIRFALFLFLPAGTLLWTRGWVFVLVSLAEMALQFAYLWRVNPEVVVARSHYHADSKRWDKLLLCGYLPVSLAILVIAAIDAGRFHWAPVVWPMSVGGFAFLGAGFALITWAQSVNKFFESTVRIQRERGHRVVDTGPYATVRHPGYVGSIFCLARHSTRAWFAVGPHPGSSRFNALAAAGALGRPDAPSGASRLPRLRRPGPLQSAPPRVVTRGSTSSHRFPRSSATVVGRRSSGVPMGRDTFQPRSQRSAGLG
jgi:protein-S-isoprenylcysteine O-methyltransferase Ste14